MFRIALSALLMVFAHSALAQTKTNIDPMRKAVWRPTTQRKLSTRSNGSNFVHRLPMQVSSGPQISKGETVTPIDFRGDLRSLPQVRAENQLFRAPREMAFDYPQEKQSLSGADKPQTQNQPAAVTAAMPLPNLTFKGLDNSTWGAKWPPDAVGDVGQTHYVQAVNTSFGVFDKVTGALITAATFNTLFSGAGTGTACDTDNQGDPTVIFDRMGGRWIVSDFAFVNATAPPFYQCIAVSKTSDPVSGGWWFYAIRTDDAAHPWLADSPKMGIWPDGLYMTANMLDSTSTFREVRVWAFNRLDLESGAPLRSVVIDLNTTTYFSLLPSNLRGPVPPSGRENLLVTESLTLFAYHVFKFHVDYSGSGSTFTGPSNVSQTSYTVAPTTSSSPGNALESQRELLMMQNQYRNRGGVESLWVNHTVRTGAGGAPNGIQWAQINVTGGTVVSPPVQQQVYGNLGADGVHRWMGSLAVDNQGNMALGYSASRDTLAPDIRYAGRLSTDALNTLPQTEVSLIPGAVVRGNQTGNCPAAGGICQSWGQYSAMSVDPADDCTFWYTNEYYETSGTNWQTRIGSFRFPTCVAAPTAAGAEVSGSITTREGLPLGGVTVSLNGGQPDARTITDSNGRFRFNDVRTGGFYSVTPSQANYTFSPAERTFSLPGNKTDAVFTATAAAIPTANAIDSADFFVRQHYLDFLAREPDHEGLDFWTARIAECGVDQSCISNRRIDVSAAYFMSEEFQTTSSFVYGLYKGSLGRNPRFAEFMPDRSRISVGGQLNSSKQGLADEWVTRAEFRAQYPEAMTNAEFVNKLNDVAGLTSNPADRERYINSLNSGGTRSQVLRAVVENNAFMTREYNRAFVLTEYFGYLGRDPDPAGYDFWLNVLNSEPNNYRAMACSFITSAEYQKRFSPIVSHHNSECGH